MKSLSSIMSKSFFILTLLVSFPAGINTLQATIAKEKQPLTVIRFVGKADEMLLFDISFNFSATGRFSIMDEYGAILFDEKVQQFVGTKRFKISAEGIRKLHFESMTKEEVQRKTFVVAYYLEEKLTVTEVQ